ncbi:MAG: hypothetical protein AMJ54_05395 [Deltaproteobacteria bacterium SG8_13]|nr:MAG: hypothetical protein AMJ54_05395 [Deltaproteobacteria bacterium SG8_13]
MLAADARADYLRFRGDWDYTSTDSEITNKLSGDRIDTASTRWLQQYNLDFSKTVYPYLNLLGGVLYQMTDLESAANDLQSESGETFLRPFVRIGLDNPIYRAGAEFRHTNVETDVTGGIGTEDLRDEFDVYLGWLPAGLPEFTVRYNQVHTTDGQDTRDTLEKTYTLESVFNPGDNWRFYYYFQRDEDEDNVRNTLVLNDRHTGRINYGRRFLENRLALNTGYQLNYTKLELPARGEVDTDITPSQGLSSIDDTPDDGPALAGNPALIDGNVSISAGLDIGLGGDETTLTNIGLDLGLPTDINKIRVWVDQRLTAAVSNSFSWAVYTSPDNLDTSTWTQVATVFPALFDTFEFRFDITFPTVTTRYLKVVVRPLSPLVPGAASFPNIFVTEMEPFLTLSGLPVTAEQETVDHNVNLTLTGRISPRTSTGYDLNWRTRKQEFAFSAVTDERSELANGLFLRHIFNPVFSTNARLLRTDTTVNDDTVIDYTYGLSLRADYLRTFNQILTFSGTRTELDEGTGTTDSVFLRSNAILYRDWSAYLDLGYSREDLLAIGRQDTATVRLGTNLVPHRTLTFNLDATLRLVENLEDQGGDYTDNAYNLQMFFTPYPALSLFGKVTIRDRDDETTTVQNYSVSWSPFPDGAIQFSLTYAEILRLEEGRRDRNYGPFLAWNISRHLLLESQYTLTDSEDPLQNIDSRTFRSELIFTW